MNRIGRLTLDQVAERMAPDLEKCGCGMGKETCSSRHHQCPPPFWTRQYQLFEFSVNKDWPPGKRSPKHFPAHQPRYMAKHRSRSIGSSRAFAQRDDWTVPSAGRLCPIAPPFAHSPLPATDHSHRAVKQFFFRLRLSFNIYFTFLNAYIFGS